MSSSPRLYSEQLHANVLVLHGHGQSGQFISCKTHFLQAPLIPAIRESLQNNAPYRKVNTVNFYYPTGMFPANPDHPRVENNTAWAWGHGNPETEQISGLQETVEQLLGILEEYGPFIGIMGFSTGATIAAALTSILEKRESDLQAPFEITHPPFRFAVCFSGFRLEHEIYDHLYSPKVQTPILHVVGNLDPMIEPGKTKRLAGACANASVYQFLGTHYIPRSVDFVKALTEFVKQALGGSRGSFDSGSGSEDDEWEDV
ncbi:hypothetical protein N7451_011347 [Penicillium sp. IBT 35674x]|nr:hypothetical protein N7451_011347 [Penicillium sp. IBT 35674x]